MKSRHAGQRRESGVSEDPRAAPRSRFNQAPRRVGRGIAGKGGKTAGRGTKGAGARGNTKPGFEGGQLPLTQRIPKLKGFKNPFRVEYTIVNLDALERLGATEVDPDVLRQAGLVHKRGLVKVLGVGQLTRPRECLGPRLLRLGRCCHRGRGRFNSRPAAAVRARPAPGKGQRAYQSVAATARTGHRGREWTDRATDRGQARDRTEEN